MQPIFPYPGNKLRIVNVLNEAFGKVKTRIDPFCGSSVWMFNSPPVTYEIINDISADVVNFLRALKYAPDEVLFAMDFPMSEIELLSYKIYLKQSLPERTQMIGGNPDWYDATAAGRWAYAMALLIGDDIYRKSPWVSTEGKLTYQSGADGVQKHIPTSNNRKLFTLRSKEKLRSYLYWLSNRLKDVRILCCDFEAALGNTYTQAFGTTAILLDPPYPQQYHNNTYSFNKEDVWFRAAQWAIAHGEQPNLRIAVCGYITEETDALFPESWRRFIWRRRGGYSNVTSNTYKAYREKECVWFNPLCNLTRTAHDNKRFWLSPYCDDA